MRRLVGAICCPLPLLLPIVVLADTPEAASRFTPAAGLTVTVVATKSRIDFAVASGKETRATSLPLAIESQPHVSVKDFNFDGHLDFEVWYVGEGMGKYTLHRLFIFDGKSASFVEARPKCGDEFLNLLVDKTRRTLSSTYYVNNRPMRCMTRLGR